MSPSQLNDAIEAIHYDVYEAMRKLNAIANRASGAQRRDIVIAGRKMRDAWEGLEATIHNHHRRTRRG